MTKVFFSITFTSLIIAGINFFSGILVARMLLPEERGLLGSIIFFVPIISFFFISGVQESTNYYISKYQKNRDVLVKTSIVLGHKLSFLALIISLLFQIIYFRELSLLIYGATIIFSLQSFFGLSSTIMLSCDLGNYNFNQYNKTRLISFLIYLFGIFILYMQDLEKDLELFWLVLLNLILILSIYIYRIGSFLNILKTVKRNKKVESALFFHGLKFHYSNMLSFLNQQVDKFIIMKFISLEAFGYYLIAWNFLYTLSSLVSGSLGSIAMPYLRRSKNIIKSSLRYAVYSSIVTSVIVIVIGVSSSHLISILYSENYKYSEILSLYLILPIIFILIKDILYKVFKSNNLIKIPFYAESIFIVIFVILVCIIQSIDILNFIWIFTISLFFAVLYLFIELSLLKKKLNVI